MKSLPSADKLGLDGKVTVLAFSITSSLSIFSCVQPSPNGRLPNSIWYNITPADHTSTCALHTAFARSVQRQRCQPAADNGSETDSLIKSLLISAALRRCPLIDVPLKTWYTPENLVFCYLMLLYLMLRYLLSSLRCPLLHHLACPVYACVLCFRLCHSS